MPAHVCSPAWCSFCLIWQHCQDRPLLRAATLHAQCAMESHAENMPAHALTLGQVSNCEWPLLDEAACVACSGNIVAGRPVEPTARAAAVVPRLGPPAGDPCADWEATLKVSYAPRRSISRAALNLASLP